MEISLNFGLPALTGHEVLAGTAAIFFSGLIQCDIHISLCYGCLNDESQLQESITT